MHRLTTTLLITLATAAALAVPVATVTAAPSSFGAEARCRYHETAGGKYGWTAALLKKIAVRPPTLDAKSGQQVVGWRFVVQRSLDRQRGPWIVTYRSPIQKRPATTTTPAAFDAMRVAVTVPTNVEDQAFVWYTVTLKLFWYRADGRVASKVSYLFPQYRMYVDGVDQGNWALEDYCPGEARQFFDGP